MFLFSWQAADAVSFEQAIDAGTGRFGQRLLHQVHQVIERQSLLVQGQDQRLLAWVKGIFNGVRTAAFVFGAVALLPPMRGGGRDLHLLGQGAATFWAEAQTLPLLFVGGCVRMNVHACSFLWCGYQEDYRMHPALCNPTVHNDMKLDRYALNISPDMETLLQLQAAKNSQDITGHLMRLIESDIQINLSEYAGLEDFASSVAVIQAGLDDMEAGRTILLEDFVAEMEAEREQRRKQREVKAQGAERMETAA